MKVKFFIFDVGNVCYPYSLKPLNDLCRRCSAYPDEFEREGGIKAFDFKPLMLGEQCFKEFCKALSEVTMKLCKMIASDGEGATKLIECTVKGAKDDESANKMVKSVISSSLFKAAMFGADANWGRVLCAAGYSGAEADFKKAEVEFFSEAGNIVVCKNGAGLDFDEELAKKILSEKEITVTVTLKDGNGSATGWGCDLTYDYVRINGDYRT